MEVTMNRQLTISQVQPFVRLCHYLSLTPASYYAVVKAYDHRLFFAAEGTGSILVDAVTYTLQQGDLLLCQAGTAYQLLPSEKELKLIALNFDFTLNHSQIITPIPPDPLKSFRMEKVIESVYFSEPVLWNQPLYAEKMHAIAPYLTQLMEEYTTRRIFYEEKSTALLQLVLSMLARSITVCSSSAKGKAAEDVIAYIQEHYEEPIQNQRIGEQLCFHPNYLNRLMIEHTGVSLHQYLLNYRLTKAIDLLQTTEHTIGEIALMVGFGDINHFSKYFKKKYGICPSRFLRN